MANYHEFAVREVLDPNCVGTGTGEDASGEDRIVVSLEGERINGDLDPTWESVNWVSLTPECAKRLYELLGQCRHLWEQPARDPGQRTITHQTSDGRSQFDRWDDGLVTTSIAGPGSLRESPRLTTDYPRQKLWVNTRTNQLEHVPEDSGRRYPEQPDEERASLQARFDKLVKRWLDDTRVLSSAAAIIDHPAYQEIIAMGPKALPLIFRDLEKAPRPWGPALHAITGAQPVAKEHEGRAKLIAEDWLRWARDNGCVW